MSDKSAVPLKFVCNLSKQNPLVSIQSTAPLYEAVLSLINNKVHRLVVIQPTQQNSNKFLGVLSLSTIAAYLVSTLGKPISDESGVFSWREGEKTIEELGLVRGQSSIISVLSTDTVPNHTMLINRSFKHFK
jgi:signal-transduction protein with cAMP-binding, CBS, and nucleotidyltransferase domain